MTAVEIRPPAPAALMPVRAESAADLARFSRDLVTAAFRAQTAHHQEGRDPTRLTMSGLGGCTRACAYSLAGTEPSDVHPPEDGRMAMLGTYIHLHLLPAMARLLGPDAVVEQDVQLSVGDVTINGTLDLACGPVVWDLKTVREWRLHGVRRRGTYSEHRVQVLGYALARYQAGHPVRWVVYLYIDRSTGEVHAEVEQFSNAAAMAVIERVNRVASAAADPDRATREGRGPGLSFACDRCPWLRRCWGLDAVPAQIGPQRTIAATQPGIEYALAMYDAAAAAASTAELDKKFAKAILDGTPHGVYGPWKYSHTRDGEQWDRQQIEDDYAAAGRVIPTKPKAGAIIVRPA